ncbi:23S rRNA (guanosine(2251)-2'-O)-methyltransferase RlmB [Geosporobacter ferrireducens]|uniref:23S rRNA (Guanosine(2251)-2'-O)-methyltransferase RlmB n=1 Tax=Geosporobacter ferrireducens TaxID=1424294 RepID=A0A1D8GJP4_9FIRM|nr:23S rRNA (guanosine(2251)-2'-O)-methyltransferase RlmB [Geosporobacter ferrireducens]AOT71148.1 23S rRNA (guanosine(2251)-2'-O)-methyltransferase RlmB [Geosporobacter ferrireducens]MTI57959.1 23S rRNA (guanosine(2251)-2'-O)-methyltransferase RlmB [Geosporobacter ferrireducens]
MTQSDKIEGRNPVLEALKAEREIDKIFIAKGAEQGSVQKIVGVAKDRGIPIQYVERQKLDQISESHAHQGIIAFVAAYRYVEVDEILESAARKEESPFIVILDEITDPHNLGSILRTANAAGVHGVIIPKRRAVGLTAVVAKTSAGAIEYVPVAKVSNISQTIEYLKEKGLWVVGADMDGQSTYYEQDLTGNVALVIGSEGQGIGRLIKEKCDFIVRIPMKGQLSSLNASVAASLLMYEVMRQRDRRK